MALPNKMAPSVSRVVIFRRLLIKYISLVGVSAFSAKDFGRKAVQ